MRLHRSCTRVRQHSKLEEHTKENSAVQNKCKCEAIHAMRRSGKYAERKRTVAGKDVSPRSCCCNLSALFIALFTIQLYNATSCAAPLDQELSGYFLPSELNTQTERWVTYRRKRDPTSSALAHSDCLPGTAPMDRRRIVLVNCGSGVCDWE